MADTLSTGMKVEISWTYQEALDLSTVLDAQTIQSAFTTSEGTATLLADKIWHDQRTVAGGANDDLDLNALTNSMWGGTTTINLVKVRWLWILNTNTGTGEALVIDTSLANSCVALTGGASGKIPINPGSPPLLLANLVDGFACTNGATDKLRITNTTVGTSITYKIVIAGTSA